MSKCLDAETLAVNPNDAMLLTSKQLLYSCTPINPFFGRKLYLNIEASDSVNMHRMDCLICLTIEIVLHLKFEKKKNIIFSICTLYDPGKQPNPGSHRMGS